LRSGAEVLSFVESHRAELEEAHLVTALHRVAKSRDGKELRSSPVLQSILRSLGCRVLPSRDDATLGMTPRHLANTVWALARLAMHGGPLL